MEKKQIGTEPASGGVARLEIDESKIIGNFNKVYYMFGMIDRVNKNARVYYVLDNRTKESLLPLIKNNIYTIDDIRVNHYKSLQEIHDNCFSTRIYSDYWRVYQMIDFKNYHFFCIGLIISLWFGRGNFNTNTVEGLWSSIKRLCKDFTGINISNLDKLVENGINIKDNMKIIIFIYF